MSIAVVIPIYFERPTKQEEISLIRCLQLLSCEIFFASPENLNVSWYESISKDKSNIYFEKFSDAFFRNIESYNKLLLSPEFYHRFLRFKYILIHQLDVFLFNNNIEWWCNKNFYYVGAPWLETSWHHEACRLIKNEILNSNGFISSNFYKIMWWLFKINSSKLKVGNGGCSLRKVKVCYKKALVLKRKKLKWYYNEDLYWSIYLPLTCFFLNKPSFKDALMFSFDINPKLCFKLNKQQLPFAAHAWFREDEVYKGNFDFWQSFIPINVHD